MGKYTKITSIVIQFSQPDLHRLASGDIDVPSLYATSTSDELTTDPMDIIRRGTVHLLTEACLSTPDFTRLPLLVSKMAYSWCDENDTKRRIRNTTHLDRALEYCLDNNLTEVIIYAHCDLLFFDHNFNGTDLDKVDISPFPKPPSPGPVTPSHVTPVNPTAPPLTPSLNVTPPTDIFNYQALPSDVLKRYDAHQDPSIILRVTDMTPFLGPTGNPENFYINPFVIGSRVILQNGAVLEGTPDQKLFSKDPPACAGDTPASIRSWYRTFTNHALSCGYFVVPYELLSKNKTSSNGFDFGTDLPAAKTPHYYRWQNEIGRLLKRSSTFPANSQSSKRAASSDNGYHILLAIVSDSHPAYVDQPILLAMHWPKQSPTQDIFGFYNDFIDNVRLRSIFLGGADDMKSAHMVDCFIQSCQHSSYLTQVSRFDRKDTSKAHLFAPGNIAITLTNYLANSDSPAKPPAPHRPFAPPRNYGNDNKAPITNPYHRHRIKQLLTDANSDLTIDESTLTTDEYNQLTDIVINEVRTLHPLASSAKPKHTVSRNVPS
jgi:hypothetical protein